MYNKSAQHLPPAEVAGFRSDAGRIREILKIEDISTMREFIHGDLSGDLGFEVRLRFPSLKGWRGERLAELIGTGLEKIRLDHEYMLHSQRGAAAADGSLRHSTQTQVLRSLRSALREASVCFVLAAMSLKDRKISKANLKPCL